MEDWEVGWSELKFFLRREMAVGDDLDLYTCVKEKRAQKAAEVEGVLFVQG